MAKQTEPEITVYATTRLPESFYHKLRNVAVREHRSLAGFMRLLLEEAWKHRTEKENK